jgi:hypothetical protein
MIPKSVKFYRAKDTLTTHLFTDRFDFNKNYPISCVILSEAKNLVFVGAAGLKPCGTPHQRP